MSQNSWMAPIGKPTGPVDQNDLQVDDFAVYDWPTFQLYTKIDVNEYWALAQPIKFYDCAKGWPSAGPDIAYQRPDGTYAKLPKVGTESPGMASICNQCSNQLRCMVGGRPRFNPKLVELRGET